MGLKRKESSCCVAGQLLEKQLKEAFSFTLNYNLGFLNAEAVNSAFVQQFDLQVQY